MFQVYTFYPCGGSSGFIFTSNVDDDLAFMGANITFPDLYPGQCFHVILTPPEGLSPTPLTPDVTIDWDTVVYTLFDTCETCNEVQIEEPQCLCSTVTNTLDVEETWRYIDCAGNPNNALLLQPGETSPKLCIRQWLNLNGNIQYYGDCIGDKCPSLYLLTDCSNSQNTLCSNSTSLNSYADNGTTVVLNGYPGICWTVETVEDCPNPIAVVVANNFTSCPECLSIFQVNYLLLNCETQAVIYTSTNLSEYVGQVVSLIGHTDDCWQVIALNSGIPSDAPVEVDEVFPECIDCTSTYYLLEDCNLENPVESIVTNTDLSAYVGEVVTLTTCPEICWQVSETDYVSNYQITNLETPYENCEECLASLACKCVQFTNNENTFLRMDVILCDGKTSILDILSGETSPKLCLSFWYIEDRDVTVIDHGDCIDNQCPPEPPPRRRKVRPGYNTPVCSTQYYERVVCNFSEWMYKDVLEKRYGISNCCPEELLKWQIKHEMLMLDVLVNPDYECQTSTSCCGPTLSMNYTRTCNS